LKDSILEPDNIIIRNKTSKEKRVFELMGLSCRSWKKKSIIRPLFQLFFTFCKDFSGF